jgi:hypothetical protein
MEITQIKTILKKPIKFVLQSIIVVIFVWAIMCLQKLILLQICCMQELFFSQDLGIGKLNLYIQPSKQK